ncbi:MAG: D-alanine--D-alanine ligase [Candidatus Aminicenantes bacterium RBG_13_62_12]|nr:MAG: D-alanine--D-alanine ligase [Candidatus Aminicenantes bacterium RBG_13_62_12]
MIVALVFSSKNGMAEWLRQKKQGEVTEEDSDPPPDMFAECDSDETIRAILQSLEERHQVIPIEADREAYNRLRETRPDLVFNISERLFGSSRESHIPVLCEMLDLPYTGSDPLTLGICLDKSRAKEILSYHGIPTPEFWTVEAGAAVPPAVTLPAIVKPLFEGSSKGITDDCVVRTRKELEERAAAVSSRYSQPVIIEKFLGGREFTVGLLGNPPSYEILPIVEIDHGLLPRGANPIYSYEAKWVWDTPENPLPIFRCPANISGALEEKIREVVARACRLLRVRDWCRVDVRLDEGGEPNVLEVNPLPGILPNPEENSCLPKAARTAGYSYSGLIHRVVEEAARRWGLQS